MKPYFLIPFLGLLALIQTTLAPVLAPFNVKPDLMLVTVVCWSVLRGAREGTTWAFVGGLSLDMFSSGPFGLSALALMVISLTASLGELNIFRSHVLLPLVAVIVGTVAHTAVYLLGLQLWGNYVAWFDIARRIMLPTLFVNILLVPLIYPALNSIHHLTGREEITW